MIKLKKAVIHQYRCIETEQTLDVKDDITILMGCNEAGKTSILEALAKSNYFDRLDDHCAYDPTYDYPRRRKRELDRRRTSPLAVTLTYEVQEPLLRKINEEMMLAPSSTTFARITNYKGKYQIRENGFEYDPAAFWEAYASRKDKNIERFRKSLASIHTKEEYNNFCERMKDQAGKEERQSLLRLAPYFENRHNWENPLNEYVFRVFLLPNIPKFMYYDEYYLLPSRISLDNLQDNTNLTPAERTAKAFLALADIDLEKITNAKDSENYKSELEAVQTAITNDLLKYWTNNPNLRIVFEIIQEPVEPQKKGFRLFKKKEKPQFRSWMEIRILNLKTGVSLPLENRSRGFNWFFSFWVWFKAIQRTGKTPYILLLDEPGLNLHAAAQQDLLHLMQDLSKEYQTLFTTHSTYLLGQMKEHIYCVTDGENGTVIRPLSEETDKETLLPLELYNQQLKKTKATI